MIWLLMGFVSALMLGCYDMAKKQSLKNNAVIPVLFLNTLFCSLLFVPVLPEWSCWDNQRWILIKSFIVLSSWLLGYFGIKNLPLTIVGPINATRPVLTLLGALLIFGERLNMLQWAGVLTAFLSLWLLSQTGKKEGIDFRHNSSILCVCLAAVLGACSSLYDKFLMATHADGGLALDRIEVQAWYNIYQCIWMFIILVTLWLPKRKTTTPFRWSYTIVLISVFLTCADLAYLYALSFDGAMVSIVSMVRRSNVIVSFLGGVLLLGETNWKRKALDLLLIFIGMILIWLGTR